MKIFETKLSKAMAVIVLSVLCSLRAFADAPADLTASSDPTSAASDGLPDAPSSHSAAADDSWRFLISIYGWFPGMHGTVGVLGHDAGVHMPFSDLFHYLKGVIPIAFEADKGRFVMPLDFFWVKLGDNKGIPFNELGQTSVDAHITESIFTPKVGYRIIDGEHMKVDALVGLRYWHLSQSLTLVPSQVSRSQSANWVDGLGGGRFIFPLGEKAAVTIAGDAGGGGASSDYQVVGLFTYKFTQKLGLGLGWRYLDVNYFNGNKGFLFDAAMTGALAGLYVDLGGKPPVPPAASCSASPAQVMAGESVKTSISTQNFKPKHPLTYKWSVPGAKVSGSGDTATVDTAGLAPGSYTVTGTAIDEKEKKNNSASCNATFAVMQPPQHPPTASCSASPSTVKAGDPATVSVNANSPDGAALSYAYSTTGGTISGSGSSATLDTASAQPGSTVTATATVTDSRGLSTSCNASINVLSAPITVQEEQEVGECKFKNPKKPWRVDNECKAVLDDVALRIQREPNGKFVVVGYSEDEESVKVTQLGAQRAVNVKYYLVEGEGKTGVDPGRLEPRTGVVKAQSVKIYYVPSGATFQEESVTVDETQVKGQSRNAPAPKKKAKPANTQQAPPQ
jgi:hypothetical protein